MSTIFYFLLLLLFVQIVLMENYRRWFLKLRTFIPSKNTSVTKFSVIIPARNEALNIEQCLLTVLNQQYPVELFEVIVVDDFSTDDTSAVVQRLQQQYPNLQLLQLSQMVYEKQLNSYKKKAIELAIKRATGDWIVTTDADCFVTDQWLFNYDNFIQLNKPVFIAAPVKFINSGSFVSIFQCLDFMSLQGITAASVHQGIHSMCNGANLAYSKIVFNEVDGFKGIDNIASGDDMLLMHKVYLKYPDRVQYLHAPSSVVQTLPMATWKDFLNQRIRWASKADKFKDKRIFAVLAFIYFFNLSFFSLPFLAIWHIETWWYLPVMLAAKTIIELRFMLPVAKFFKAEKMLWWFPIMQPVHIIYTVTAGWLGEFGNYSWKGRTVK